MRECRESFSFFFFLLFLHYFQKTKKKRFTTIRHQNGLRSRPRIINTFWYNNDFFFSQETKKLESVFCLVFFFILQCLRLFSIDLVRIFFVFHFTLQFLWAGG